MIIKHEFNKKIIKKESEDPGFLITNRNGSYYSYAINNSRYDGFFIFERGNMYKIIDEIIVNKKIGSIINKFANISLERENLNQTIFMFKNFNSLVCLFDKHNLTEFLFDVKKSYDNRSFGRFYRVYYENDKIIIEFDKKTSHLDNENDGIHEYTIYIVINEATFSIPDDWIKKFYPFDNIRNSMSYERYVYHGLKIISKKLVISASLDKNRAINENNYILKNLDSLISEQKKYINHLLKRFNHKNKEIDFAFKCAVNSLDQLSTEWGLIAGLPWFFQYWARDEILSTKSLALINKNLSAQIINRYTEILVKNNIIYSNSASKLAAKDALGLLTLRADQLKNGNYKLIQYLMNQIKDGSLIENKPLETWMDTGEGIDNRAGYRIEIQALYLKMSSILYKLTRDLKYKKIKKDLLTEIRLRFFNGRTLKDGMGDKTIRPNIFLAFYYYPELLSKEEWTKIFDISLPNIWNHWGGLSTIEKSSPLFQKNYTGENNLSYHRGDSWFYLNNLAAICLHRLSKKKYNKYIKKILVASIQDILWNGYIGFHSELSSSSKLKAEGCKAQAWSSALFIELINEIKK